MTRLIIARHGNTFAPEDTPRRVGRRTDLSLVEKGREQASKIGVFLKENSMIPDVVYASHLKRTIETAELAVLESGVSNPVYQLELFNEIDYGPDENKPEAEVIERLGADALRAWDAEAKVPEGWLVDPSEIIKNWQDFADQIRAHDDDETVLVVTSNGIARFAPHITGDFEGFKAKHPLKLSTGALGVLEFSDGRWNVVDWNVKP